MDISNIIKETVDKYLLNEMTSSIIYHWASPKTACSIISTNEFRLRSTLFKNAEDGMLGTSHRHMYYMSMTRNGKIGQGGYSSKIHSWVRFTLDGDLLNANYHIKAIDYWGKTMGKNSHMIPDDYGKVKEPDSMSEWEDRLYNKQPTIENAMRYVKHIDIYINDASQVEYISQLCRKMYRYITLYTSIEDFNSNRNGIEGYSNMVEVLKQFETQSDGNSFDFEVNNKNKLIKFIANAAYVVLGNDADNNEYFRLIKNYGLGKYLGRTMTENIDALKRFCRSAENVKEVVADISVNNEFNEYAYEDIKNAYKILTDFCTKNKLNTKDSIYKFIVRRLYGLNYKINYGDTITIKIAVMSNDRKQYPFISENDKWIDIFPQDDYKYDINELYREAISNMKYGVEMKHNSINDQSFKNYLKHLLRHGSPTLNEMLKLNNVFPNDKLFQLEEIKEITLDYFKTSDLVENGRVYVDDYYVYPTEKMLEQIKKYVHTNKRLGQKS